MLAVTTPGGHIWNNFPPVRPFPHPSIELNAHTLHWKVKGLLSLTKLLFTPDPVQKIPTVMDMLFPAPWLAEKATSDPHAEFNGNTETNEMGKTNRDVQSEVRSVLIIYTFCQPLLRFNKFPQSSFRGFCAVSR